MLAAAVREPDSQANDQQAAAAHKPDAQAKDQPAVAFACAAGLGGKVTMKAVVNSA